MKRVQQGFTLIELMIVVAIIGILAAIAIPAYQNYVARSVASAALAEISAAKTVVDELLHRSSPATMDVATAGLRATTANCTNTINPIYVAATGVMGLNCAIRTGPASVNGQFIRLSRAADGAWTCTSNIADAGLRPSGCDSGS